MDPENGLTDEVKKGLKDIVSLLEAEDRSHREKVVQDCRRLVNFWKGNHRVYWDETAKDYRALKDDITGLDIPTDKRTINNYRAHGESIIAAMTVAVPNIRFFPRNADNIADIYTAKAESKISELIDQRNQASILFTQMLYILYNQPFVAAYIYEEVDGKKYGYHKIEETETQTETIETPVCPICGGLVEEGVCPIDGPVEPVMDSIEEEFEVPTVREVPKNNARIEVYGPLNVKVAQSAKTIEDTPYLILEVDQHHAFLREMYPEHFKKIQGGKNRGDSQYNSQGLCNYKRCWLRAWSYNVLSDDEAIVAQLKELYPDGALVHMIDDEIIECEAQSMDDFWKISVNPLGDDIYGDPIGKPYVPIQEMENDIVDLTVESIFHGIPQTFADPELIDFNAYGKVTAQPGQLVPAKRPPGMGMDSAFFTVKTAQVSDEINIFAGQLKQAGQFVVGNMPSVFGGAQQGGSKTLGEYETSRNQALQRLGNIWKFVNLFWVEVKKLAVKRYRESMMADDSFVQENGGSFINVWIRREELSGEVGEVRAEGSDQFPVSWIQKRAMILELLNMKNPAIEAALFHSENVSQVSATVGFPDLYIPGEDSRNKQLAEISQMIREEAVPGMMGMESTVPVDIMDDHVVELETCKAWIRSEIGQDAKLNNPGGYANVMAHAQQHEMALQQQQMQQMMQAGGEGNLQGEDAGVEAPQKLDAPPNEEVGMI